MRRRPAVAAGPTAAGPPTKAIALGPELYDYIVRRFASAERGLLARMRARAREAGLPEIMISEEQARLVFLLARIHGATRALDVGTLFGYSAAVLAQAMGPKGRVVSLEVNPVAARVARENLAELGLGRRVDVREGPALATMAGLRGASFDLVLIDADKENYGRYLEESVRLVRRGGLLLADNAFAFGRVLESTREPDVVAIQRFNDELARRDDLEAVLVPVGDGMALARKR